MSRETLLDSMSAEEYSLQLAAYNYAPWGEAREDMRMARIAGAIYAAAGVQVDPADLLFDFDKPSKDWQTEEEIQAAMAKVRERIEVTEGD